jgi:hypothetical protein
VSQLTLIQNGDRLKTLVRMHVHAAPAFCRRKLIRTGIVE